MAVRFEEEKRREIFLNGVKEFADLGYENASMRSIAKTSGVSIGVLYKYYKDKEDFFESCLSECIKDLESALSAFDYNSPLEENLTKLLDNLFEHAQNHRDALRLYLRITTEGVKVAEKLSFEIEGKSAELYTSYFRKEQEEGRLRKDIGPEDLSFFFDNLLMLLQFSLSCPYYERRRALWKTSGDEKLKEEVKVLLLGLLV